MKRLKFPLLLSTLILSSCDEEGSSAQESTPTTKKESEVQDDSKVNKDDDASVPDVASSKLTKAQEVTAQRIAANLMQACENYYEEYGMLPLGDGKVADAELITTGAGNSSLMAALVGLESAEESNPKGVQFFEERKALDDKNGLKRTSDSAELFDPWGNPYHVILDYDYDEKLKAPDGTTIFGSKVYVWSPGPDGKHGTPEFDADNFNNAGR